MYLVHATSPTGHPDKNTFVGLHPSNLWNQLNFEEYGQENILRNLYLLSTYACVTDPFILVYPWIRVRPNSGQ